MGTLDELGEHTKLFWREQVTILLNMLGKTAVQFFD